MDESNTSQSFYIQSNGSSSSRIHLSGNKPGGNISSIGFNTLKKMPTNSSSSSITTSSSTTRTNPLSKLFSKNKSVSSLHGDSVKESEENSFVEDSSSSTLGFDTKKNSSQKFRISRSRLKFSKNNGKPDLTIQTNGHHGLRIPKTILSSTSLSESGSVGSRRNSISSPISTFHSFFHRSHAGSSPLEPTNSKVKIEDNNSRSALCLSSNSSNSYITDIKLAMIYKFTDPNYSIDEIEGNTDYNSFHRRMLLPADSYIQSKIHKNSQDGNIVTDESDNESVYIYSDFSKTNSRFYVILMNMIKPLFVIPPQKNPISIGHSSLGHSIEDISAFIKENLFEEEPKGAINSPNKPLYKSKHNKPGLNNLSLPNDSSEDLDYFKAREVSQDVLTLFSKCLTVFKKDITNIEFKTKTKLPTKGIVSELMISWHKISFAWSHFNKKIRFYVLSLFEPLQRCFDNILQQKFNSEFPQVNFENELLIAFRDVILVPFLLDRKHKYFEFTGEDSVSDPESSYHTLFLDEQTLLQENSQILSVLIDCFGTISCHSLTTLSGDGEQFYGIEMVTKTFDWLSSVC